MIGDLTDQHVLRAALREFGVRPSQRLSQNFLVDRGVLETIVDAAGIPAGASVLEVGAGTGVLTRELAARAQHVLALELDRHMIPLLRAATHAFGNVRILEGDVLQESAAHYHAVLGKPATYHIVANLPYHISSRFLQHFLASDCPPDTTTLLLQREVAERVCAQPGDLSLLALSVQVYAEPAVVATVPRTAFWPEPAVESAILHISRRPRPVWDPAEQAACFRYARLGFQHRRKTLANALAGGLRENPKKIQEILEVLGLHPNIRAQEVACEMWPKLVRALEGRV